MQNCKNQKGFTLIEVLVAILMLTIGLLGAATMQIAAINGNSGANRLTEAATLASDTNETLMALPYSVVSTDPMLLDDNGDGVAGLDNTDVVGNLADGGPLAQEDFTVFWNVADDYPVANCKTIRVHVRRITNGITRTVTLNFTKKRSI